MVLDTKKSVVKLQLQRFIIVIVFILLVISIMVIPYFRPPKTMFGLNRNHWAILISGLYVLYNIFEIIREINYIYFSDEKTHVILRYFSASIFNSKKNSIEIPKDHYAGYEIKQSLYGHKKKIILQFKYKDRIAKYPAVSLSILNKEQYDAFLMHLNKYESK